MKRTHCRCGHELAKGNQSGKCSTCAAEERYPAPTLDEIREGCLAVQATWSDVERSRREAVKSRSVETRVISMGGYST